MKLEVTDAKSVEDALKAIEADFRRLDIVINNAGILGEHSKVQDSDAEIWWQTSKYTSIFFDLTTYSSQSSKTSRQ